MSENTKSLWQIEKIGFQEPFSPLASRSISRKVVVVVVIAACPPSVVHLAEPSVLSALFGLHRAFELREQLRVAQVLHHWGDGGRGHGGLAPLAPVQPLELGNVFRRRAHFLILS